MKRYPDGKFILFEDTKNRYEVVCNKCNQVIYKGIDTLGNVWLCDSDYSIDICDDCAKPLHLRTNPTE